MTAGSVLAIKYAPTMRALRLATRPHVCRAILPAALRMMVVEAPLIVDSVLGTKSVRSTLVKCASQPRVQQARLLAVRRM